MHHQREIQLSYYSHIHTQNAGLFISRGEGKHPRRIISSTEIIFVENGILGIREGNYEYLVESGQSLILEPGIEHSGTLPYDLGLRYYWIHFDILVPKRSGSKDHHLSIPKIKTVVRPTRIIQLFRWFLHDQEEQTLTHQAAELIIYHLITEILFDPPPGLSRKVKSNYLLEKASIIIKTEFNNCISPGEVAARMGCNPDYLNRLFKSCYGMTISSYIQSQRINHACSLLINCTDNIDHIAYASGYNDSGYFRRSFRKKLGMTPRQYRGLYTQVHINTE